MSGAGVCGIMEDDFGPFRHLNADQGARYRAVLDVFVQAKARFVVHLRPEDVLDALPPGTADLAEVGAALAQLAGWGNLRAHPDTGRVTTLEDFNRARFLYQLTGAGEAAERALSTYAEALSSRGELQTVALADIREGLAVLRVLAKEPAPDAAKAHRQLIQLAAVFQGLAENAQAFMGGLQRTIDLSEADVDAFVAYKERLIGYLERFVGDLTTASADIAATLVELDVDGLLRLVAAREATDAVPDAAAAVDTEAARLAAWRARWQGLRSWFLGDRARPSQAALLRARARKAIADLLGVVTRLNERRAGRSDRSADFRALARWFAEAPTPGDAHRIWRVAFGLAPARHLSIDAEELDRRELDPVPPTTSWADAPPITVSPRLRATGSTAKRGAVPRVVDRSEERRLLAERLADESAQVQAVRRRFATGRPLRLSELGALDREEFALFLALLGEALAAGPGAADGTIETITGDGALAVCLSPMSGARRAAIETPAGTFRGPDHVLTVTDLSVALPDLFEVGA